MKTAMYAATRNLYPDMIPAVKSLLINSDVDKVYFLIEDDKFPYPLPDIIECRNVRGQTFFRANGPNCTQKWTYMVLMRAAASKLFPDDEFIVSLDVDTIVDRDISMLWDYGPVLRNSKCFLAACVEPKKSSLDGAYFNMGVILLNLEKLRRSRMDDKIIRELNTRRFPFCEQDCINQLCKRSIYPIPSEFNANDFTKPCDNPRVVHFANVKDWNKELLVKKYRDIPWKEIRGGSLCVT